MADSPAKRHLARRRAALAAAATAPDQFMDGTGIYEQTMMQLVVDKRRLKQIQSGEGKAKLKAELLPAYVPYIEGVLSEGRGACDEVVTTVMLWHIDAGNFAQAFDIADYVLRHDMPMPDQFQRTTGCVVAEEVADAALNAQRTSTPFDGAVLDRAVELTVAQDMPDQVRAKLLLARARNVLGDGKGELPIELVTQAVEDLRRAITLHDACGGKEDLKRAERLQNKHADSQNTD